MKNINNKDCWNWMGTINDKGYGVYGGISKRAHRIIYEFTFGKIQKDLQLDHLCRNRKCVNPKHLEPVTRKENILRGISPSAINARKKKCKRNHNLSGKNLIVVKNGRDCRLCRRIREMEWRKNNPQKAHENDKRKRIKKLLLTQ